MPCRHGLLVEVYDVSGRSALEEVLSALTESQLSMVAQMCE